MTNQNNFSTDERVEDLCDFLDDLGWFTETGLDSFETAQDFWVEYDRRYGADLSEELVEKALEKLLHPVFGAVHGDDYVQEFLMDWLSLR